MLFKYSNENIGVIAIFRISLFFKIIKYPPKYPHEQTIYYCAALASFGAIVDLIIAIWHMVNRITYNPKAAFSMLIGGVTTGILAGFTTCLPLFI